MTCSLVVMLINSRKLLRQLQLKLNKTNCSKDKGDNTVIHVCVVIFSAEPTFQNMSK